YFIMLNAITKLREFSIKYKFKNKDEEINFFKVLKPKFFSELIYYRKISEIQSNLPVALSTDASLRYLDEFNTVKNYIDSNREFFNYYKSGSSLLDEIYFVKQKP